MLPFNVNQKEKISAELLMFHAAPNVTNVRAYSSVIGLSRVIEYLQNVYGKDELKMQNFIGIQILEGQDHVKFTISQICKNLITFVQ